MPFETAAKRGQGFQVLMVHSAMTKLVKKDSVQDQESDEQEKMHVVGNSLGMSGHHWDCVLHNMSPILIHKNEPDIDPLSGYNPQELNV